MMDVKASAVCALDFNFVVHSVIVDGFSMSLTDVSSITMDRMALEYEEVISEKISGVDLLLNVRPMVRAVSLMVSIQLVSRRGTEYISQLITPFDTEK